MWRKSSSSKSCTSDYAANMAIATAVAAESTTYALICTTQRAIHHTMTFGGSGKRKSVIVIILQVLLADSVSGSCLTSWLQLTSLQERSGAPLCRRCATWKWERHTRTATHLALRRTNLFSIIRRNFQTKSPVKLLLVCADWMHQKLLQAREAMDVPSSDYRWRSSSAKQLVSLRQNSDDVQNDHIIFDLCEKSRGPWRHQASSVLIERLQPWNLLRKHARKNWGTRRALRIWNLPWPPDRVKQRKHQAKTSSINSFCLTECDAIRSHVRVQYHSARISYSWCGYGVNQEQQPLLTGRKLSF